MSGTFAETGVTVTVGAEVRPPFRVLLVCTANHCRSPIAEHLLRERVDELELPWTTESAGTHAARGVPMHPRAAQLLVRRGHDVSAWSSRSAEQLQLGDYDLILTATESNRGSLSQLAPAQIPVIFTLLQFAHLVAGAAVEPVSPEDFGPNLLDLAVRGRTRVQPMTKSDRDLADPMGHGNRRFRQCARTVNEALDAVTRSLSSTT